MWRTRIAMAGVVWLVFVVVPGRAAAAPSDAARSEAVRTRLTAARAELARRLDGSATSVALLESYGEVSLADVADAVLAHVQPQQKSFTLPAEPNDDLEPRYVKELRLELSDGAGFTWAAPDGGTVSIDVMKSTVSRTALRQAGKPTPEMLDLRGPMQRNRALLWQWLVAPAATPLSTLEATLSFWDERGACLARSTVPVIDYYYLGNEILLIAAARDGVRFIDIDVLMSHGDGEYYAGPPRVLTVLASRSDAGAITVVGINFDEGAVAYFNGVPAPLFDFEELSVAHVGAVAVGRVHLPAAAPLGPGAVVVEYGGELSPPYPFTVR